ncbi:hypothetical protein IAT40_007674 [Kwoniella sp. CBS 6097]
MFVLKSLLGKMWGNPANPELIQIPAGQLYLVRPNSIKGSRECIFQDAVATIRRAGVEFQYQLVVTRAYEEGEEQLLDEDAETTNSLFELTLLHCIYERVSAWHRELRLCQKYSRSHDEATDAELEALKYDEKPKITVEASAKAPVETPLEDQIANLSVQEDPFKDVPVLHRATAELYLFDTETDVFVIQEKEVDADLASNGDFENALPGMTWCLRFKEDVFAEWKDRFTIYMWEGKNKTSYAKAKADEQRYIQEAYEDVEMAEPEEEDTREESGDEEEEGESGADTEDEAESDDAEAFGRGSKNQQLAVGYKNDMSFVARGDMIGVFAHQNDKLQFRTAIDRVKNLDGKSFSPGKMMLHNQDGDMLLLDPTNKNSVYRMDLEYGKVVDEWKVSDTVEVNNIIPDSKYAQMNPQQTLIGHSHNGLFRIDPRVSGNKLVESQFKQYATKNDFSAAVTTESGKLAVASNKGDIRLFDAIGKNAKLKPEHAAYMEDSVSFTPARFNTGVNEAEKTIVTSTGKYVITWNFRRLKQGRTDDYQIKQYGSRVVADNFKFGADKNIIVALEHNVLMANKKELAKPTRSSLAPHANLSTPTRKIRQSHSDIVDSPY